MLGIIIRILPNKGYAFVRGEDGLSRFAHVWEFIPLVDFDRAREGRTVEFIPTDDGIRGNKLRATHIRLLPEDPHVP